MQARRRVRRHGEGSLASRCPSRSEARQRAGTSPEAAHKEGVRASRPMDLRDDPFLHRPIKAAASFRMRWRGGLRAGVGVGAAVGPLVSLVEWLLARRRSGLPSYSYVAVDADKLYIAELRYGSTISVRRVVGTWGLSNVDPEPLEDPWAVRL